MPALQPLPNTRPISDLRTHLTDIEEEARDTKQPIVLTRNGSPSLVVMDCEAYNERIQRERHLAKLREAQIEAKYRPEAVSSADSRARMEKIMQLVEELHA